MKKVITFLGKYPKLTHYEYQGTTYSGKVFPEALRKFLDFDEMLVFVTKEAHANSWPVLSALDDPRIRKVEIPIGDTSEQMWSIFDIVTSHVKPGENVIFDITHGLRSLPFLVFLFAAYLKASKHVAIEGIYYGAFELGDADKAKPAPVINLTGFVSMLDWLTASNRFIRFGDSQDLAGLLRDTGRYRQNTPISQAIESLEDLSLALRFIRPVDAMKISATLPASLESARLTTDQVPEARPYSFLVEDLKAAYASFSIHEPFSASTFKESIEKQRDLVGWYIHHNQWVQAVSLAREWYITWVMYHLDIDKVFDRDHRESIASLMSNEAHIWIDAKKKGAEFNSTFLNAVPEIISVLEDWLSLTGIRNDIDHAGMRVNAYKARSLKKSIIKLYSKLTALPLDR